MTTPLGQNIRTRSIEVIPIVAYPNNLHVPERLWTLSQFGATVLKAKVRDTILDNLLASRRSCTHQRLCHRR